MKEFNESKCGLSVDRVCFYHGENIKSDAQLIRFYRCDIKYDSKFTGIKYSKDYNYTLVNNLTLSEEDVFSGFNSNYRNEIRRISKDGNPQIDWIDSMRLNEDPHFLDEFEKLHEQMLVTKNKKELVKNYNHLQILEFIKQECFILTRAQSLEGGIVYHGYLCDGKIAILQHSCSDCREKNVDRNCAGRLNKYLHWADMKHFKSLGYELYDWGNTFDEGPVYTNGIDKFKAGFGGESVKLVSAFRANSFIGLCAVLLRNFK